MHSVAVDRQAIESTAFAALVRHGASTENAQPVARALALAEAEGNRVCGLFYLPHFCAQLEVGKINGKAVPQVHTAGAVVRVDAATGFAHAALDAGIPAATAAARALGVAVISIQNSYNALALGHFVRPFAEQGLIALAMSNAPASVAPAGATTRLFGTNPLAWAAPVPGGAPIVVDQSLSAVTKTAVVMREKSVQALEPGWAQDKTGHPTLDPATALAGSLLPMGGQKGANIALLVEILSVALSGSNPSPMASMLGDVHGGPPRLGQFVLVLDPAFFDTTYGERLGSITSAYQAAGLRLPGSARSLATKIEVNSELWQKCEALAHA